MSYHGGMIGLMIAGILFTRSKGGNLLSALDLLGAVATIGICLGRIANFINAELYGAPTTLPWGVIFPTDPLSVPRHPSQLYEAALEGVLLFLVIRFVTHVAYGLRRPASSPASSPSAMPCRASSSNSSACPMCRSAISMAAGSPWARF